MAESRPVDLIGWESGVGHQSSCHEAGRLHQRMFIQKLFEKNISVSLCLYMNRRTAQKWLLPCVQCDGCLVPVSEGVYELDMELFRITELFFNGLTVESISI